MTTAAQALRNAASINLRTNGRYVAWVQSPNGAWMLLSGHWARAEVATQFLVNAGYKLVPISLIIGEIERQMEKRMYAPDPNGLHSEGKSH
jgi:hypothetical protein